MNSTDSANHGRIRCVNHCHGFSVERHVAAEREDLALVAEVVEHQRAEEEHRRRDADQRQHGERAVEELPGRERAEHAEDDAEARAR